MKNFLILLSLSIAVIANAQLDVMPPPVTGVTLSQQGNNSIVVAWNASPDTNVLRYYVRVAAEPYTTPETVYWTTNLSIQVSNNIPFDYAFLNKRYVCVQAFNPWHQSDCGADHYVLWDYSSPLLPPMAPFGLHVLTTSP